RCRASIGVPRCSTHPGPASGQSEWPVSDQMAPLGVPYWQWVRDHEGTHVRTYSLTISTEKDCDWSAVPEDMIEPLQAALESLKTPGKEVSMTLEEWKPVRMSDDV